jgi:uncharacterized protein (DUF302 family)
MNLIEVGQSCAISEPYETGLKLVRSALLNAGLSISGEFDVSGSLNRETRSIMARSKILYVDSPLRLFEALALDRAAAVLLPLHVLVASQDGQTRVSWVCSTATFGARLPPGAASPIEELQAEVGRALRPWLGAGVCAC